MGSREKHTRGGSIACVRGPRAGPSVRGRPALGGEPTRRSVHEATTPQGPAPARPTRRWTARMHGAGMAGGRRRRRSCVVGRGVGGGAGVILPRGLLGGPTSAGACALGTVCGRRPAKRFERRGERVDPSTDGRSRATLPRCTPQTPDARTRPRIGPGWLAPSRSRPSVDVGGCLPPPGAPPVSAADNQRRRPRHLLRTLPPTSARPPCSSRLQGCSSSVLAVRVSITYFPARAARTVSPRTLPTFARPRTPPIAQILPRMRSSTAHFRLTTGVLRYLALSQNLLRRISQFPFVYSPSLCAPVSVCNFFVPHKEGARLRLQAVWYAERRTTTVQQDQ